MRALRNAGVKYFGNRVTSYVTKNGVKVAFVGYVSKKILVSRMKSEIQSAAKKADVVVVTFHWTDVKEFNYAQPSSRQRSLARSAINYGADLGLGAHTHRLNGIERYKGKYIVYDLGNFVTMASNGLNKFGPSNPNGIYDYDSMIYQQRIRVWQDGFVEPADIKIIPCAITSQYADLINDAQPTPYETGGTDYQRVMERIRTHSPSDYADYPINGD